MSKKRILWVIGSLNICSGITSYAMSYYKFIKDEYQIDFVIHDTYENSVEYEYYKELIANNSKIYFMGDGSLKNIIKLKNKIKSIFDEIKYDAIHCHLANYSYFYFSIAKKYKISCRIMHSHATKYAEKKTRALRNFILDKLGVRSANYYCACSALAGDFLFKKRKYTIIKNAINGECFYFDDDLRRETKENLQVENQFVIGHIGRFSEQKNHKFLIDLYDEYYLKNKDSCLLLIGDGPLYQEIINYASKKTCYNNILFLGNRSDICSLLNCIDVLVLPSKFEGFPVVAVEAQFVGTPLLMADTITKECKLNDNVYYLPLKKSEWIRYLNNKINFQKNVQSEKYDIKNCKDELVEYYNTILK